MAASDQDTDILGITGIGTDLEPDPAEYDDIRRWAREFRLMNEHQRSEAIARLRNSVQNLIVQVYSLEEHETGALWDAIQRIEQRLEKLEDTP